MRWRLPWVVALLSTVAIPWVPCGATAGADLATGAQRAEQTLDPDAGTASRFFAVLDPLEVVPSISSVGRGALSLEWDRDAGALRYELSYADLEGVATEAQLRFGQRGVNGGVLVWLCGSAARPGPAGTPACPSAGGSVSGTVAPGQVVGPVGQGIRGGELDPLVAALRDGAVYVHVHSVRFPVGEVRGQVRAGRYVEP